MIRNLNLAPDVQWETRVTLCTEGALTHCGTRHMTGFRPQKTCSPIGRDRLVLNKQ